jgi:hypothetical protein
LTKKGSAYIYALLDGMLAAKAQITQRLDGEYKNHHTPFAPFVQVITASTQVLCITEGDAG